MANWVSIAMACSALSIATSAKAADFSVCDSIAGKAGTLVDKSNSAQWQQSVDNEFNNVCKDTERYESSLAASSDSTQASFGFAGYSLGYGQSASDANARTSKSIDAICKTGKSYVSSYFHSVNQTVSGQYAADLVADCLRTLAQADVEALSGTTEVSTSSDTTFFIRIVFKPSSAAPNRKYKLVNIQKDPTADLKCWKSEGKDAEGDMVVTAQGENTFTCTRKQNTDVNGYLNFASEGDDVPSRSLRFSVPSLSGRELIREEIKQQIEAEIDSKIGSLRPFLIPPGGIVAVDDPRGCDNLGDGWENAHFGGKFIAGADASTFRTTGGATNYTLTGNNLPELNLIWRRLLSGNDRTFRAVEGIVFGAQQSDQNPETSKPTPAGKAAPDPINTLPPYIALYYCKRTGP